MFGIRLVAGLAAVAAHGLSAQESAGSVNVPPQIESAALASALDGKQLQLSMRGTSLTVLANATPAEDGCAALLTVQAPGSGRIWTRLLRWSELAWAGVTPEGATMVSFFEEEGRLPGDRVIFRPLDGARFAGELQRVAALCRAAGDGGEYSAIAGRKPGLGCHFAVFPALQLHDPVGMPPQPPRAVLSMLSRETPEAELQILVEQAPARAGTADDWGRPFVAFTFADPALKAMGITAARFALDGKAIAAEHALATYGDTRLRISMDPFMASRGGARVQTFFDSLATREQATLTLLDASGRTRQQFTFDVGPALDVTRRALQAARWTCAGAQPPPLQAANWLPED